MGCSLCYVELRFGQEQKRHNSHKSYAFIRNVIQDGADPGGGPWGYQ